MDKLPAPTAGQAALRGVDMKLVVGLGNPLQQYAKTRHNAGFWVVDEVARRLGVSCTKAKWSARVAETRVGSERVILCKPQTFMNNSGESIRAVFDFFRELEPADMMAVHDDMDLPVGELRLRLQGSAGGHNGVRSLIAHVGSEQFARVRLGIGRPPNKDAVISYVLSPFTGPERETMDGAVSRAADAVLYALENSFTLAMNRFNGG